MSKVYLKNKIKERHNTIKYLIENWHLDSEKWTKFSKYTFKYLKCLDETSKDKSICYLVPLYNPKLKIQLNKSKIYPFEIAYDSNDSMIRIETLLKWNEITSCVKWLKQSEFSHIIGFSMKEYSTFYSKYIKEINKF